ncbi:hypothetical protein [Microcystis sp. MC19]|nr:hypothetical protein [Microcystis sp. MC19]
MNYTIAIKKQASKALANLPDRGTRPLKALSTKVLRLLSYKQIHRFQPKS